MNERELRAEYHKQDYSDVEIDVMLGLKSDDFGGIEGLPLGCMPDEGKPYPGEHACRLQSPGKYTRFARKNCFRRSAGKCIDFIFGIVGGKSEVQAMRYKKTIWTAAAAATNCKDAGGTFEAASKG